MSGINYRCWDEIKDKGAKTEAREDYTSHESFALREIPPAIIDRYDIL